MNRIPQLTTSLNVLLGEIADQAADQLAARLRANTPESVDADRTIARSVYRTSRRGSTYTTAASNLPTDVRLSALPAPADDHAAIVAYAHRDAVAAAYGSGETPMGEATGWYERTIAGFEPVITDVEQRLDKGAA